jgi:hypothetical protein
MRNTFRLGKIALLLALAGCGAGSDTAMAPAADKPVRLAAAARQGDASAFITFSGNLSQYTISGSALTITDNVSGSVQAIPANARLRFADTAVALDLDGVAGQAYRLYQAAFNRKPDLGGLGFQMNAMEALNFTLTQVAQNFIDSPEFSSTYGSLNTTAFVTLLYANVLHRAPDPDGLAFHVGYLDGTQPDGKRITRAQDLTGFSESPENKAQVLDAIKNGIEYTPFGTSAPSNPPGDFANTYSGNFHGADGGTVVLTVSGAGALSGTMHSNLFNVDLTGTSSVAAGGRYSLVLTGGGHSITLSGSINLATGLATGSWAYTGTQDGGSYNATKPAPPPPTGPTFSTVQAIIVQRCVPCHSAHPTMAGFNPAPLGIQFDTEAQIRGSVSDIKQFAVSSKVMPYANMTNMTDAERATIGAWINAGTP